MTGDGEVREGPDGDQREPLLKEEGRPTRYHMQSKSSNNPFPSFTKDRESCRPEVPLFRHRTKERSGERNPTTTSLFPRTRGRSFYRDPWDGNIVLVRQPCPGLSFGRTGEMSTSVSKCVCVVVWGVWNESCVPCLW